MYNEINKLFEMLDWNNDVKVQQEAIEKAKDIKYLSIFFQPLESKSVWKNCAKIICSKEDKELNYYLIRLFEWLQDMNWPGAFVVYERLMSMSSEFIVTSYSHCLKIAILTDDYSWKHVLKDFALEKEDLVQYLSEEQKNFINANM